MTENMKDLLWIVLICFVMSLPIGAIVWGMATGYTEFMGACMQDHTNYVCRTMYRSG